MKKQFSDKQLHILDVAEELIAQKGFDGTSVRDISAKAQVNVAMISYYFGSKEKMMVSLYQYRVLRTREHFAAFNESIRDARPEVQLKEVLSYVVNQLLKYKYFHGFVTQEIRHTDRVKDILLDFYQTFVTVLDEIIRKGHATGIFKNKIKSEDLVSMIIGTVVFVIRNPKFYEIYLPEDDKDYLLKTEKKVRNHLLLSVFSVLGYQTP